MIEKLSYEELSKGSINHLQQIHSEKPSISEIQNVDEKIKFQNITYFRDNGVDPVVKSDSHQLIDYFKAKNEIKTIDWKYKTNFIGFVNHDTFETLQMVKLNEDEWYVENLIGKDKTWQGYIWYCQIDQKEVLKLLEHFFEESHWFRLETWTLKRI